MRAGLSGTAEGKGLFAEGVFPSRDPFFASASESLVRRQLAGPASSSRRSGKGKYLVRALRAASFVCGCEGGVRRLLARQPASTLLAPSDIEKRVQHFFFVRLHASPRFEPFRFRILQLGSLVVSFEVDLFDDIHPTAALGFAIDVFLVRRVSHHGIAIPLVVFLAGLGVPDDFSLPLGVPQELPAGVPRKQLVPSSGKRGVDKSGALQVIVNGVLQVFSAAKSGPEAVDLDDGQALEQFLAPGISFLDDGDDS